MAFFAENEYLGLQNGVKRLKTAKFCFIREILLFACLAGIEFAFFPVEALDGFCLRMFFLFFIFLHFMRHFWLLRFSGRRRKCIILCKSCFCAVRFSRALSDDIFSKSEIPHP